MKKYTLLMLFVFLVSLLNSCSKPNHKISKLSSTNNIVYKNKLIKVIGTVKNISVKNNNIEISFRMYNLTNKPLQVTAGEMTWTSFRYIFKKNNEIIKLKGTFPLMFPSFDLKTIKVGGFFESVVPISSLYPSLIERLKEQDLTLYWKNLISIYNDSSDKLYYVDGKIELSLPK